LRYNTAAAVVDAAAAGVQAYILFRAKLASPFTFSSGPESLEVELFDPAAIPFDQIAFSSVSITLQHYLQDMASGQWHLHHGVIDKVPGAAPNDPASFQLRDHFSVPVAQGQL
jgi:ADP-ribose/FAD diphosphatase